MLQPTDLCHVTNRSNSIVCYEIPEKHIRREFNFRETKTVPYQEILDVSAQQGGRELIYNNLYINEIEAIKEGLNINPEPEYFLTEDKIDEWIVNSSIDEFKDALDFAPDGVRDLIKAHCITLPLNDIRKADALKSQLGFNVLKAIQNERDTVEGDVVAPQQKERRVQKSAEVETGRRTTPKYKVVGREDKEV